MFKKLIGICLFTVTFSASAYASDLSKMCAAPYDMSWKSTKVLTNVTGMTFLTQAIANSIIKGELKKATGSKGFKANMKSFSANDLAAGRFKSLTITGKNLNLDGVHLSEFNASTICEFNYIKATKKSVKFKENFAMNYSMAMSNEDLKKTVLSKDYLTFLHSMNFKMGRVNLFELEDVDVNFKNDKFYFSMKMKNTLFNYTIPFNMDVSSKMKVQNGKIKVSEVALENLNQKISLTQVTNILNMINPLNFTVNILDNEHTKIAIKTLDIKNDKLTIDGTLFVPKNTEEVRK